MRLWQQVRNPGDYEYSAAKYYELDDKNFRFLNDLWEVF